MKVATIKRVDPKIYQIDQYDFLIHFNLQKLDLAKPLYNKPWISFYAKLLVPISRNKLQSKKNITQGFIKRAASLCMEFVSAADNLAPAIKSN